MSDATANESRKVFSELRIYPVDGNKFTWRMEIGVSVSSTRYDAFVESRWDYHNAESARAAARRWAKRLGIILSEEP